MLNTAKNFFGTVPVLVYLAARSSRCFFENNDYENEACESNGRSQSYLAMYFVSATALESLSEYYPPELRERFTITSARIAKLDLGFLDGIQFIGIQAIFMCSLWQVRKYYEESRRRTKIILN